MKPETHIFSVIAAVAKIHGIHINRFTRRDRQQYICHARHMAIYSLRYHFPKLTLAEIASIFGRHHSAIINSLYSHQRLLTHDRFYRQRYQDLQDHLSHLTT